MEVLARTKVCQQYLGCMWNHLRHSLRGSLRFSRYVWHENSFLGFLLSLEAAQSAASAKESIHPASSHHLYVQFGACFL